ncbi:Peroxiredoxin-5, mitochondrial, partial [Perkinsus olseni]
MLSRVATGFAPAALAAAPASRMMAARCFSVAVGDALPDVTVREADPGDKKSLRDIFGKDKGILFGVPGAFTPTCDQSHLPGYVVRGNVEWGLSGWCNSVMLKVINSFHFIG